MAEIAKVLIDGPSELIFDYAVPETLAGQVRAGSRVRVPLRHQRATGTVTALVPAPDDTALSLPGEPFTMSGDTTVAVAPARRVPLKPLTALIADQPVIPPALLALARWIADYYAAPLEQVMRSLLPMSVRNEKQGFHHRKLVTLAQEPEAATVAALETKAPRQAETLARLAAAPDRTLPLAELPAGVARALEAKKLVVITTAVQERVPEEAATFLPSAPLSLNEEQAAALAAVLTAIDDPAAAKPLLLFGVTGSGKTEVYLQAAAHALARGRTVLVLVPEISLTPQTIERFKARFAGEQEQVAVLHSHLGDGERHDEWHRIARSGARIVIGARSAVFAPLENLGLIIVDEEHEASYKQDTVPRYHGRDVAVMRAKLEQCAIVLGSATPGLESWRNTQTGKYGLLTLSQRIDGCRLPLVRVVDLRLEKSRDRGTPAILSEPLRLAIDTRLQRGEQTILFLNRRGYAGAVQCLACGHAVTCPHCSVTLVLHRQEDRLICHICGFRRLPLKFCPECQDPSLKLAGYGTERAEETLRRVFPHARLARVDTDTMGRKHQLRDTLLAFQARKLDLLIGTQMIAKGLHFPNVTLVGILYADLSLHLPDFRAGERTFQLLTQVAGRAGRGEVPGEVIVQTFAPHVPAIQFARHGDFTGFAEQELEMRQAFSFPPYASALLVTVRSENEELARFTLDNLTLRLKRELPDDVQTGEPSPSPLQRAEKLFRFQLLLRARSIKRMLVPLRAVLAKTPLPKEVTLVLDIDPYSLA